MAGGGESLGGGPKQKRGSSKRKAKSRVGFKVDMTPLVDITFLLLTFFMFTTTMASPQVMEMSVPPERDEAVEVRESDLFTIFLTEDNSLYWRKGSEAPESIEASKIQNLAIRQHLDAQDPNKIITALKVSEDAKYDVVVNILDELNLAEAQIMMEVQKMTDENGEQKIRERRFTIADITEEELEELEAVEGGE
jgi:biopolymer transport protein ExbD